MLTTSRNHATLDYGLASAGPYGTGAALLATYMR